MLSLNRCLAVYFPTRYKFVFTKKFCLRYIAFAWVLSIMTSVAYVAFPCNLIGYSPTLYEYVFMKCRADLGRDVSIVGSALYYFCGGFCATTFCTDVLTFIKITYIRKVGVFTIRI
ncbi:hypothetical protein L596_030428 [Steinernema carpocapsae]|uniref:G-protein coupled receptors family 1 profile domain-containing protein n=1 Tax=Steinernema carpocapsae TaxID=34508 RepID=A0A4U5LPD7_STECR|nr:hypothetical protein L596_030428 [Steinernema carpocapsae]